MEAIGDYCERSMSDISDEVDAIHESIQVAEEGSEEIAQLERNLLCAMLIFKMVENAEHILDFLNQQDITAAEDMRVSTRAYMNIWESLTMLNLSPRSTNTLAKHIESVDEKKLADDADAITSSLRHLGLSNMMQVTN